MEGCVWVVLRLFDGLDEFYLWNIVIVFLCNVVMGEKYLEFVGLMYIFNDSIGYKVMVEFKSKGMFGVWVEEVQVDIYNLDGSGVGGYFNGNWMIFLWLGNNFKFFGEEIWYVVLLVENVV